VQGRQIGDECIHATLGGKDVSLHGFENVDQAAGGGPLAWPAFGVQRQRLQSGLFHRSPQLAFQQGLSQHREEVDAQQRLNSTHVLQVDRRDLEVGLKLRKPLFNHRLPLMSFECLECGELADIGDQREHSVACLHLLQRLGVDFPLQVKRERFMFDVLRLAAGPAALRLPVLVRLPLEDAGPQPGAHVARVEYLSHRLLHLFGLAKAGPRSPQPPPQIMQLADGVIDLAESRALVPRRFAGAMEPPQAVAVGGERLARPDRYAVRHLSVIIGPVAQRFPSQGLGRLEQAATKVVVFLAAGGQDANKAAPRWSMYRMLSIVASLQSATYRKSLRPVNSQSKSHVC